MRIKFIAVVFVLFLSLLSILAVGQVHAISATDCVANDGCDVCPGPCGVANCVTSVSYITQYAECQKPNNEGPGCWSVTCYDDSYIPDPNTLYTLTPGPGSFCSTKCDKSGLCDGLSCVSEKYESICDCPLPTGTPTPTPTGDGGDVTPTPTPTPGTYSITGLVQEDNGAALSGNLCTQATSNPVPINNLSISSGSYVGHFNSIIQGYYSINTSYTGSNYTVTLDLSKQTGLTEYICSCPAAIDPNNPYLCQYTGITSPSDNINFYLQANNLSNSSWFQVFGGHVFGRDGITSIIPYNFCSDTNDCQPALTAPNPLSANLFSSGFPISNIANNNGVKSYDYSTAYHSYFHLPTKEANLNSYDVNTDLNQLSYDYFYKLVENSSQEIGNGEDLEPLLNDWTGSDWWLNDETNYIKVSGNVNIDETQDFNLTNGQSLVVFVDGNLILDDSNTNDTNHKITSVAQGGFLAFIVSGDIIVTADVGYELDPLVPSTPTVSNVSSNVEGVFVANHDLIIQSKTAIGEVPPDRKFIGAGTFVGWDNVLLNRTFDDNSFGPILNNSQAIENFVYRPDLLANWPVKLKASTSNWREVDPQFISQ